MFSLDNTEVEGNQMVENIANVVGELSNLGYNAILTLELTATLYSLLSSSRR